MNTNEVRSSHRILWRRIDGCGLDACSFEPFDDGCIICGTAIYSFDKVAAKLDYKIICKRDWSTRSATLRGWLGTQTKELEIARRPGGTWTVNDQRIDGVDGLVDVDLGFTPATNTNAIKRLDLETGAEAETTAVWLDPEDWRFKPLKQIYLRTSGTEYSDSSPSHHYNATLVTDAFGIVQHYPNLWIAVANAETG